MTGATKPNAKRKHRLYVDVTFSAPVSHRDAAKGLQLVLDWRLNLTASPVWGYSSSPYIDKITITEIRENANAK